MKKGINCLDMTKIITEWAAFHTGIALMFLAWPFYVARNVSHLSFPPIMGAFFAFFFTFDRISKEIVWANMLQRESIPIFKPWLYFTYVQNRGAAFGLFQNMIPLFAIVALASSAAILIYARSIDKRDFLTQAALGLLLSGALGNLYDRMIFGCVVDFIDIRIMPVFNIADMAINAGVIILFWQMLFAYTPISENNNAPNTA